MPLNDIQLTEREMLVAQKAAKLAVQEVANEFYKQVGRGFMARLFIWVGMGFVGFAVARGWLVWR
jgi:voltage-gated potassium channel Kch